MSDQFADELLTALAQQVGIPDLQFDEQGLCILAFDTIVLNVEVDRGSQRLFLFTDLGPAAEGLPEAVYREVLEANLFWKGTGGATLSLEPKSERFYLAHTLPAARVSSTEFIEIVERFVDQAEQWQGKIAQGQHPTMDAEKTSTDSTAPSMFV